MNETPASKAGLKQGDTIVSIDGTKVTTPAQLIQLVATKGVGHKVKIKYLNSKNEKKETQLALEAMPGLTKLAEKNLLGKKAPSFKTKILSASSQKEYDLENIDNKVKIIEFWATWCGACMQAHPVVSDFASKNKSKITVLSISEEDPKKIKKFLHLAKEKKVLSDAVLFLQGSGTKIQKDYFVPALPMFIVLDSKNIVRHVTIGTGQNLLKAFEVAKSLTK
jgi:thiol-disulfide isomerase/thioredoxin